ncbi:FkbM family methyltransferase, partial [Candidatus Pelagibacter sp.]|uniref:FkbM family methyltransferase n=1 Tax=Candidatus Pelagibacter sp. TaxID=2024849 RepID=UPI003F879D46
DIIKLDVEGYEDQVISGAINIIKKYKPILYIERPSKNIVKTLRQLKYKIYIFDIKKNSFKRTQKISKKYRNYYFLIKKELFR